MAKAIAEAAMDKYTVLGFKVSVVVIDSAGLPLVMRRGDGAGLHTPEGADRKAYTARTFGASSAQFGQGMVNDPTSVGSKESAASSRYPAACRSRQATKWSAPSASPDRRAETTNARRPASIG